MGNNVYWVIAFYAVMTLIAFFMYGIDKKRAKKKQWRISETVLLGTGLLGGALGALLGMKLFRHKTKHGYFWVVNVLALAFHSC